MVYYTVKRKFGGYLLVFVLTFQCPKAPPMYERVFKRARACFLKMSDICFLRLPSVDIGCRCCQSNPSPEFLAES